MKKIIPFKKDITFTTNLSEITSISLEHEITNEGHIVHGTFTVSGRYKVADTSKAVEDFNYELPFEIKIDDKYDVSNITMDIDDFYYEVINNNILSVNIDVLIDKLEERELEEHIMKVETMETDNILNDTSSLEEREEVVEEIVGDKVEDTAQTSEDKVSESKRCVEDENEPPKKDARLLTSLFDNLDDSKETYQSYHVYIVREGDNLEKIMQKYEVSKEELEDYNDLSELKVNDKIIVPKSYGES